jgi:hypothetical protein
MRTALFLAAAAALAAPAAAPAADPPITFQAQPAGRMLNDARVVARMIGGDAAVKDLEKGLKDKLGEKGFDGLDLNRPIVGYVFLAPKLDETVGVVAVPVTGEKEFLALLGRINEDKAPPKDAGNGLYEFSGTVPETKAMMRFRGPHAYVAIGKDPAAALDPAKLLAPDKLFDAGEKAQLAGKLYFDRLPKELREQLTQALNEAKKQLGGLRLPAEAGETAQKAVDELIKLGNRYADLSKDADVATGRLIVDVATGEAAVEVGVTGKPGSQLANDIAARKPTTNKFGGLVTKDTAYGFKVQFPLFAPELVNAAVIGLEAAQTAAGAGVPPDFKPALDETIKGLIRTVKTREFDIAAAVRGPDKNGVYTVVAAIAFDDPSQLEKELRTLYKTHAPDEVKQLVKLDVAKVGNTNIHQVQFGGFLPDEAAKLFGGDASLAFAFAPNGIFLAFGPDAVGAMKEALAVKTAPAPVLEVVVNPSRARKLLAAVGGQIPEELGTIDQLVPALALSVEGGKELRVRFGTNLKIFGAITVGRAEAKEPSKPKFEKK